jgi:hypothetical protein
VSGPQPLAGPDALIHARLNVGPYILCQWLLVVLHWQRDFTDLDVDSLSDSAFCVLLISTAAYLPLKHYFMYPGRLRR